MRNRFPVKDDRREGFVEQKGEISREYLERHAEFDFDEVEVVNNRPTNIGLYATCRKYVDPDLPADEKEAEATGFGAEVNVTGEYDGNPTG